MTLGLAGCGRMGSALAQGAIKAGAVSSADLIAYDIHPPAVENLVTKCGATAAESLAALLSSVDVLLLCTKPQDVASVLAELPTGNQNLLVISIAAGVTIQAMEQAAGGRARIIRAMPNTPALVGQGAAAFALGPTATREDATTAHQLLGSVGQVVEVKESLMDAVTGLSGSGPAYVYLFIEALTNAGVKNGLSLEQASALATQTTLGAATMILETGESPATLRDMVTSPGGTTLAGLEALEKAGFRDACDQAVDAATARSRELGA